MLQVSNVTVQFGSRKLFEDVNLKFTNGNCYGVIGANGAGKSTFLKVLSGELEPNKGEVFLGKDERMSVLMQNQNAYDNETVLRTVMLGHKRLVEIMDEKEALYSKEDLASKVLDEIKYPKYISFTVIRGNWLLATVKDYTGQPKVGWFNWRRDDGVLNMFPNFKD